MAEFSEVRRAARELRAVSAREAKASHYYRVDRTDTSRYFYGMEDWLREIEKYLTSVRVQGETAAYLDVCGTTSAERLGCTVNYQFTIQDRRRLSVTKNTFPVVGDLFARSDFDRVITLVKANGHLLSLTTFQPMAGLQRFTPKADTQLESVVYQHLCHQLAKVVEITREGGYILLERPFQFCPHNLRDFLRGERGTKSSAHAWVKKLARSLRCKIRVSNTLNGPMWLLRKGYAIDRHT
jgi:hypothetical protein